MNIKIDLNDLNYCNGCPMVLLVGDEPPCCHYHGITLIDNETGYIRPNLCKENDEILVKRKDAIINVLQNWSDKELKPKVYSQTFNKLYYDLNNAWKADLFLEIGQTYDKYRDGQKVKNDELDYDVFARPVMQTLTAFPKLFWYDTNKVYCKFPKGIKKY